jgi:rod shape-determining protein MreC
MKKRSIYKIPTKYILIFLTIISFSLITLTLVNTKSLQPLRDGVATVLTPVQKGVNHLGLYLYEKTQMLKDIESLQTENKNLKKKVTELKSQNTAYLQSVSELERLRDLYKLDNIYADYPKVAARVIGATPGNWFLEFTIDKGSEDGLKVDMNVIADSGLVGRITYVGKNYAKVSSIINDNINVSAKFEKTSDFCIVSGDLKTMKQGLIKVSNISKDAKVFDDDVLITSNISDKYLPGIVIGYVTGIKDDGNKLTKSAYLRPVVDFTQIEEVLVITMQKETGE